MKVVNSPQLLNEFVGRKMGEVFAWGDNDCCSFAVQWAQIATGKEFELPAYKHTAKSAAAALKKAGGIEQLASDLFGEKINPNFAQRGDIVLIDYDDRQSLAVMSIQGIVGPGKQGLVVLPADNALAAWRL